MTAVWQVAVERHGERVAMPHLLNGLEAKEAIPFGG
jgi:hypothetical protein